MTKRLFFRDSIRAFGALLVATVLSLGFTACSEVDTPVTQPVVPVNPEDIIGQWYTLYEAEGTVGTGDEAQTYNRVVQYARFESDGTGRWYKIFLDGLNTLEAPNGYFGGNFNYTANTDGSVHVEITDLSTTDAKAARWTAYLKDGQLTGHDGTEAYALRPANDDEVEYVDQLLNDLGLGAEIMNLNDMTVYYDVNSVAKPFTYKDWRNHEGIFINNGKSGSTNIYVEGQNGRQMMTGYEYVLLPNADDSNNSASMPNDVWQEVWDENSDWELAFNLCGRSGVPHGNMLGFYNKYSGRLRVFTYIDDASTTTASNHLWFIQMNDALSQHSTYGYALPMDRTITNKAAIGQSGDMGEFTTPWVSSSRLGSELPLTMGWWAFDIDLSVYRGADAKTIADFLASDKLAKTNLMQFTCFGDISLYTTLASTLEGTAAGDISLKKCAASTGSGIFGGIEDVLGKMEDFKKLYDLGSKIMNPNPLEAISAGIDFAKTGCDVFGIDYGQTTEGFDGYKGDINLKLNATIDTKGTTTGRTSVNGVGTPTLKSKAFLVSDDNCQTLGEGVWNIKNTPKMYVVNDLVVDWRRQDMDRKSNYNYLAYPEKYLSPFGGFADINADGDAFNEKDEKLKKPWYGKICVFDPSSIEVELNPNLFPEGTTYSVTAVCGVSKNKKYGSTDAYRKAQGLKDSKFDFRDNLFQYYYLHISDRPLTEVPFDAMSNYAEKTGSTGTKFDVETYNGRQCGVFGRGNNDYLIEPMGLMGTNNINEWRNFMLPSYEVTVTVTVQVPGREKPLVYSRTYLPEYVDCGAKDLADVYNNAKAASHYNADLFAKQKERIQRISDWIAWTPICYNSICTAYHENYWTDEPNKWDDESHSGYALIDGRSETYWFSREGSRNDLHYTGYPDKSAISGNSVSWINFYTYFGNKAKSFTVMCGPKTKNIPQNIRLLASNNGSAMTGFDNWAWTEIYLEQNFNKRLPAQNGATVVCNIPEDKQGVYKYYRLECSGNAIDYSLAELTMNYE